MLGKGLESLIPPNQGSQPQGQSQEGPQEPALQPAAPAQPAPSQASPTATQGSASAVPTAQSQPQAESQSSPRPEAQNPQQEPKPPALPVMPEEELLPAPEQHPELEPLPGAVALPTEEYARQETAPAPLVKIEMEPPAETSASTPAATRLPGSPAMAEQVAAQYGGRSQKGRSEAIFYLETEQIRPNPSQPRRHFDQEAIEDLAASIREFGILQPLTVTKIEKEVPSGTAVEYELIAGERRLLAAKHAGLERVPAIVRTVDVARERLELAVIENIQRENLSPIEMARAFARLQDEFRLTQREIATRLGKSREVVANTLRLLDLPGYIQEALEKNQVSESHGRLLLAIDDPAAQQALFHDLLNQHLTTRELRRRTAFLKAKKDPPAAESVALAPEIKQFETRLSSELGAPVSIKSHGDGGKITIEFYSPEELQQIIQRLAQDEG